MGQTLTRTLTPFDCNKWQMTRLSSYFSFCLYSPPIWTFFFTFLYWSSFRVIFIFSSVFTSFLYLYICQTTPRIPPKGLTQRTHTSSPSTSRYFFSTLRCCVWKKTLGEQSVVSKSFLFRVSNTFITHFGFGKNLAITLDSTAVSKFVNILVQLAKGEKNIE